MRVQQWQPPYLKMLAKHLWTSDPNVGSIVELIPYYQTGVNDVFVMSLLLITVWI